jgi:hypothetical protein
MAGNLTILMEDDEYSTLLIDACLAGRIWHSVQLLLPVLVSALAESKVYQRGAANAVQPKSHQNWLQPASSIARP